MKIEMTEGRFYHLLSTAEDLCVAHTLAIKTVRYDAAFDEARARVRQLEAVLKIMCDDLGFDFETAASDIAQSAVCEHSYIINEALEVIRKERDQEVCNNGNN